MFKIILNNCCGLDVHKFVLLSFGVGCELIVSNFTWKLYHTFLKKKSPMELKKWCLKKTQPSLHGRLS